MLRHWFKRAKEVLTTCGGQKTRLNVLS